MNNIKMAKGLEIKTNTERVTIENNIVSGATEKCDNLVKILDVEEKIWNGLNLSIKNGAIILNGTMTGNANLIIQLENVIKAGSYNGTAFTSGTSNVILYAFLRDENRVSLSSAWNTRTATNFTIETAGKYLYIWIASGNTFDNYVIKPMIVSGTTAPSEYQPYFEGLHYGYYKGLQLDKFSYIDKTNKIKHNGGGTIVLNGVDETINKSNYYLSIGYNAYNINLQGYYDGAKLTLVCDKLKEAINNTAGFTIENETFIIFKNSVSLICIYLDNTYDTVEKVREYLKNNNVTINYQLLTETESNIEEF